MIPREEVLEIVKGHLVDTIEELEGVEIDPAQSMKDLGANSLDIVEVVSCSMRDLKVKVPRSELKEGPQKEFVRIFHPRKERLEREAAEAAAERAAVEAAIAAAAAAAADEALRA